MKWKTLLAAASLLTSAVATEARASFTYSVAPVTTTTNFGAGSAMTVAAFNDGAVSQTLAGTQIINIAKITQTSTTVSPPAPTDTSPGIPVSLTVTINNLQGGGSSAFTVTGNIIVTRSDTQGASSSFSLTSILPATLNLGSFKYELTGPTYTAPTILAGPAGSGSLSILIAETPEPASMVLMGIGVAAVGVLAYRRQQAQA